MAGFVQGELDVLAGTINCAFLNAIARGSNVKFVADKGNLDPEGCTYLAAVARLDLLESGELDNVAQLQGRRVAFRFRSVSHYLSFGHHSRNVSQLGFVEQGDYIRLKAKFVANSWALRRYAPQPYPGQIHLFLGSESLGSQPDPRLGWCELATGGAEIHVVPGTHDAITRTHDAIPEESHLQVLAEHLRVCIDDALTIDPL